MSVGDTENVGPCALPVRTRTVQLLRKLAVLPQLNVELATISVPGVDPREATAGTPTGAYTAMSAAALKQPRGGTTRGPVCGRSGHKKETRAQATVSVNPEGTVPTENQKRNGNNCLIPRTWGPRSEWSKTRGQKRRPGTGRKDWEVTV